MIELAAIQKQFGQGAQAVMVLKGVDLRIGKGEFVSVLGPSGSGKSTLLYVISGLERPTGGRLRLDGREVASLTDNEITLFRRDQIGMVFQSYHLFPLLSAEENVALPGLIAGAPRAAVRERARDLLSKVGLGQRCLHRPAELSGGEQQRVAIARSLIRLPKILLADEPTGALDSRNGEEVLKLLRSLSDELDLTVMMVTHDQKAAAVGDRTITMLDGRIESDTAGGVAI